MSGIKDTATVTLNVNGAQAKAMMDEVRKKIEQTEASIEAMKAAQADPKAIEKAKKQLKSYQKQLAEMESATQGVGKALSNLDKATPRELERALRTLNKQLKDMTPGTAVWQSHVDKIRELKTRLKELKGEVEAQESVWSKFKNWATGAWPALDLIAGWYDQFVGNIYDCVDAFAAMDQEMASVRKFTGMTDEQVASLNDEFKKMDTRSSREQLNALAQEAGRLGKSTEEDVLGYVRAADQINVALDELGDGATLTLSKLTGIFGVEAEYGTEQALLKVGSVVNDLSQNCSASAPYLTEFASRLGGVGSQAGLTIDQIMGLGAVLDAHGQKVEASSTAISQVLVRMMQDPAKYARVAGLEVTSFAEKLRKDANGALLDFLEALNKAGGMDVLSPMFKDMGENGARAIASLSTLAISIDEVRAQQEAAAESFRLGTSVTEEFNVQNNTVQANMEKCKKKFAEFKIELGQRLYPLMGHVLTAGTALIKAIKMATDFIVENRATIISVASAMALYTVAINLNAIATKVATVATKAFNYAATGVQKSLTLAKVAILLCRVAYLKMTGQTVAATAAQRALSAAMAATPWGAVVAGIGLLIGALVDHNRKAKEAREEQERLRKEQEEWKKSLTEVSKEHEKSAQKEIKNINAYLDAAKDESKSREERLAAVKKVQELYPDYFGKLTTEQILAGDTATAYDNLAAAIIKAARARAGAEKYVELEDQLYDVDKNIESEQSKEASYAEWRQRILLTENKDRKAKGKRLLTLDDLFDAEGNVNFGVFTDYNSYNGVSGAGYSHARQYSESRAAHLQRIADANNTKGEVESAMNTVKEKFGLTDEQIAASRGDIPNSNINPQGGGDGNGPYVSQILAEKERKKQELLKKQELAKAKKEYKMAMEEVKADYEEESAQNAMDYGNGLKTYEGYIEEKERLDLKYINDRLGVYEKLYDGESEQDKNLLLMYDEDYKELLMKRAELTNKQQVAAAKRDVDAYTQTYNAAVQEKKLDFMMPSNEFYGDAAAQEEELYNLRKKYLEDCRDRFGANTKEGADYQRQLDDLNLKHKFDAEKSLMSDYEKMVDKYTTISADKRYEIEEGIITRLYEKKKITEEQYQSWLSQLRDKHNSEVSAANKDATESKYTISGPGGKVDIRSDSDQAKARAESLANERDSALAELKKRLKDGLITQEEYDQGAKQIEKAYNDNLFAPIRSMLDEQTRMLFDLGVAWADFFKGISENGKLSFEDISNVAAASFATMTAGLQTYSQFVEADKRIEIAAVNKRYDAEIKAAQGNSKKVAKLEQKKEDEIAKIKAEYAKKEFAVKVIMAVAQTAQNALMGYAAGLQAPFPLNTWMPATLAALAAAQGAIQIALLKKQQQAAAAEGYAQGGFTKKGGVNEPAGIVHAGEWVASQKLLANPVARPMIDALDYAQRTNTIGSLQADDVSRSITANNSLVRIAESDEGSALMAAVAAEMARTVSDLTDRLREPFVTINTVTGDHGIRSAQDEYSRLMRNKTPKSKR